MRGLEEEMSNFSNKVKELVDAMQKKIKDENEKKLQEIRVPLFGYRNQNRNCLLERKKLREDLSRPFKILKKNINIS
jgi:hypothetical protein